MNLSQAVLKLLSFFLKTSASSTERNESSLVRISQQRIEYLLEEHWRKRSSLRGLEFARARRLSRIHSSSNLEIRETDQDNRMILRRPSQVRRSLPYIFDSEEKPVRPGKYISASALKQRTGNAEGSTIWLTWSTDAISGSDTKQSNCNAPDGLLHS
mmetsp:Transcript_13414/g.28621  ORF Transcript_13414/g.28621 Transcript_13414/m.28621 type:complete len:157 (-) Transcript_13414:127-597(-)